MWLKNKNKRIKTRTWGVPTWKHISIMLTYANMNMKKTWQGYGVRLCLILVLNKLKEM